LIESTRERSSELNDGFAIRPIEYAAARAFIGSPFVNLMPLRILNCHVVGLSCFGIAAASSGYSAPPLSRASRDS